MMKQIIQRRKAQTAIELAVFGAILIFIIGLIVRGALNMGYMQNEQLKAMRLAMKVSHQVSEGRDVASRNVASILFIEDRLAAESGKYGPIKRTPYIVNASATHNRNLFLSVRTLDPVNLPVEDAFINGDHFVFTMARFKTMELAKSCVGVFPCPAACKGDCNVASACILGDCIPACSGFANGCDPDLGASGSPISSSLQMYPGSAFAPTGPLDPVKDWDPDCVTRTPPNVNIGCARLYTISDNNPIDEDWCDGELMGTPCPADNLTADQRFDLNRDGLTFDTPVPDVLGADRQFFSWQWRLVKGFDETVPQGVGSWVEGLGYVAGPTTTLNGGEGITFEKSSCKDECKDLKNGEVDLDRDFKMEQVVQDQVASNADGIIMSIGVMDFQDGDMDASIMGNDSDTRPAPGLTSNVLMRSSLREGTAFEVKEGRLFGPLQGQYIRTSQQKNQVDIIAREIQLSNDTDRFCDSNGNVTSPASPNNEWTNAGWSAAIPNPVEVCVNTGANPGVGCNSAVNRDLTCMDEDPSVNPGNQPPVIFVRSQIRDRRGRRWVTDTSFDDYVDIQTPPVPQ